MDKPVTDAELDQFYGTEVSPEEVKAAIERHAKAIDADDLAEIVRDNAVTFVLLLKYGTPPDSIGIVMRSLVKQLIADRVSIELFGKHGVVKAEEVIL